MAQARHGRGPRRPARDPHRGAVPALRTLRFKVVLVPQTEVRIERTNHSLFAARVAPELSAQAGGVLRNAAGALGEKGTFGASSPWCDVSGTRFAVTEGLAIFDSPKNRWFPSKWFTRDYGFFSPTPFNWLDDAGLRLAKGETLELEYLVVVHAGDAVEAGIAALFDKWAEERAATTAGPRRRRNRPPPPCWNSLGTP